MAYRTAVILSAAKNLAQRQTLRFAQGDRREELRYQEEALPSPLAGQAAGERVPAAAAGG